MIAFVFEDDHIRELLEKKRGLFAYLQSSLKNLQQSGIIQLSGSSKYYIVSSHMLCISLRVFQLDPP